MARLILDLEKELSVLFSKTKHLQVFDNGGFELDEMIAGVIGSVLDHASAYDETNMYVDELSQILTQKGYENEADIVKDALWDFAIALVNHFTLFGMFDKDDLCTFVFDGLQGKMLFVTNE